MNKIIFFVFLFPLIASGSETYTSDVNQDGKPDFIQVISDGRVAKETIDFNFDGKMDQVKKFSKGGGYSQQNDLDFDGEFDREKRAIPEEDGFKVKTFKLGKEERRLVGVEEYEALESAKNQASEVKGDCVLQRENTLSFFENFSETFRQMKNIADEARDNFSYPGKGVAVHKSCYRNFDEEDFNQLVAGTVERGLSCLSKLGEKNKKASVRIEVFNLLDRFKAHFQSDERRVQIACGESGLDWRGVAGRGSNFGIKNYGEHGLDHPFVIMSPHYEDGFWGMNYHGDGIEDEEFQGVLFHEMIHNHGYSHGEGFDVSTGCEVCCFKGSKLKDKDLRGAACRLCAGSYETDLDKDYLSDLALMEAESDTYSFLITVSKRKSEINWADEELSALLEFYAGKNPALSKAIFKHVKESFQDPAVYGDWSARMEETYDGGTKISAFNDSVALFLKSYLIDKNEDKALEHLRNIDPASLRGAGMGGTFAMVRAQRNGEAVASLKMLLRLAAEHGADSGFRLAANRALTQARGG